MRTAGSAAGPESVPWYSKLIIDGVAREGRGSPIAVDNPATEEVITTVRGASAEDVNDAVRAARRVFESKGWRDQVTRQNVINLIADTIEANADLLTAAVVSEVGTPISLARALHIEEPVAILRKYAELTPVDRSTYLGPVTSPPSDAVIRLVPSGVVGAIAAYNYPILFGAVKSGAAIAAGCTVVLLSSPQTPLSLLLLAKLLHEAGVPEAVLQVIAGSADAGVALTTHPSVDKISFTGSVAVGKQIMHQASQGLKRVALELGGKSPSIMLPSADLDALCVQVHSRYLRNAGQGCSSPTRILVPQCRYADFVEASRSALAQIKTGDPWDPESLAGPLISAAHRDRVEGFVRRAVDDGGTVVAGGGRPPLPRGWYVNPTLIGGLDNSAEIAQEEVFGPVGVVIPYDKVDDAIAIANDSRYGLSATIYGDQSECLAIAPELRVGTVMINGWLPRRDRTAGGFKQSGMGREVGEGGIREFLETQFVAWPIDPPG